MQPTIKLVPYEKFGRLRLRSFCPSDDTYKESIVEKNQGHFIEERIYHGVSFWRWSERPDELAVIHLSSADNIWPQSVAAPILSAIGLRLEGGLSYQEVASRFAMPPNWRQKEGRCTIFRTIEDSLYEVNCVFMADGKLDAIRIHRLDIQMPLDDE